MPQSPSIPSQKKKKASSSRAQKQKKRKLSTTDEGTSPSTSRPQSVFKSVGPNSRSHKKINPIAEKGDSRPKIPSFFQLKQLEIKKENFAKSNPELLQ